MLEILQTIMAKMTLFYPLNMQDLLKKGKKRRKRKQKGKPLMKI